MGAVPLRLHHPEDLRDDRLHDLPRVAPFSQDPVENGEDRAQWIEGAVVEHLRLEVFSDIDDDDLGHDRGHLDLSALVCHGVSQSESGMRAHPPTARIVGRGKARGLRFV